MIGTRGTRSGTTPYRVVDGRTCIDIRVRTVQHLFDTRDPAPFRERDLVSCNRGS